MSLRVPIHHLVLNILMLILGFCVAFFVVVFAVSMKYDVSVVDVIQNMDLETAIELAGFSLISYLAGYFAAYIDMHKKSENS